MGVTAVALAGGGFHGKSTLLAALNLGVFNKVRPRQQTRLCFLLYESYLRFVQSTRCMHVVGLIVWLRMEHLRQVPGDGREFVVTDPTAVQIRAEDGRRY